MPLFFSKSKDYLQTLLFQLREVRKIMFELVSSLGNNGLREQINSSMFLEQVFELLEDDSMSEARYLMSCIVTFPVSEAIVESWVSMIDKVINAKVAFKVSVNQDSIDITEIFVFIKVVGPCAGATSNRKLFKRALINVRREGLRKHFMRPYGKGFTSKVVSKLSSWDPKDSIFS